MYASQFQGDKTAVAAYFFISPPFIRNGTQGDSFIGPPNLQKVISIESIDLIFSNLVQK